MKPLKAYAKQFYRETKELITLKGLGFILLGTAILSFGLHNIHQQTALTEGGVLGLILLLNHWFGLPPGLVSPVLDILCYWAAFRALGKNFLKLSLLSSLSLAGFFTLWEQFPPLLPNLTDLPLAAAILGGLFVGVGVGLVVRQGGSTGGDDALALSISKATRCRLSTAYLATDFTVLLLSLSYIPLRRIVFSLVTVLLSSFVIQLLQGLGRRPAKLFGPQEHPAD